MDFALTDEQQAIRDAADRFAREKLLPNYLACAARGRLDRDLVREMGALGFIAPDLPEAFGGLGVDGVTGGIVVEALAYGDFNMAYVPLLTALCGRIICDHGAADLAGDWIPKMVAGEALCGLALTEPRGGSDAANLQLRAVRTKDGYRLNGEKTSISIADQADLFVVFARTGKPDAGARGVSAFLVPADSPGLKRTRFDDFGSEPVGRGSLFFDDVAVPAANMLGDEGGGFYQVMQGFDYSRALIGLQCVAAAQASLDESWAYVQERETFGRPLAQYQGVSFLLAEGETLLAAARLLCYETLWLRDSGAAHTAKAAMCKWFAPKTAADIIHSCLLVHGHGGYSKDSPHQQRLRDVIGLEIGDGTAQVSKLIIARERIGNVAVQYRRKE
jgi:cyclohexanecarboxyl-CoA dehydrogenase